MSKHWRPEGKIVRIRPVGGRKWTRVDGYSASGSGAAPGRGTATSVLLGALFLGLILGVAPIWNSGPDHLGKPDEPILWDEVQKAPTAETSAEDREWAERASGAVTW